MKSILLTLFLITSLTAFSATKDDFIERGAKCVTSEATICILKHNSYPNKIAYIFNENQETQDILFHLHGHSFGQLSTGEDFDSTLTDVVTSFQFNKAVSFIYEEGLGSFYHWYIVRDSFHLVLTKILD